MNMNLSDFSRLSWATVFTMLVACNPPALTSTQETSAMYPPPPNIEEEPPDDFGSYPQDRFPELTPVEIGKRFLKLIDSLKSPEEFSEDRVLEVMQLPMQRGVNGDFRNGGFGIYLPGSEWYCLFSYSDDIQRLGPSVATYKFINKIERADFRKLVDMEPVCGLDANAYKAALKQMGFEEDITYDELGRILSYHYYRNNVGVTLIERREANDSKEKQLHGCVKSIMISAGALGR